MAVKLFVTGIGTGIGKTVVSAVVTEALQADYWKPIQAGLEEETDSQIVSRLISNTKTKIHPEAFRLRMPASPHMAAAAENIRIGLKDIVIPASRKTLVIEGAGGLMVPMNDKELIIDLIQHSSAIVVLVIKHYLGSINHSLLSIEALQKRNIPVAGIIYNGENVSSEQAIESFCKWPIIGRVGDEKVFDSMSVAKYAENLKPALKRIIAE